MAKIEINCPKCGRKARTVSEKHSPLLGGSTRIQLTCGHSILVKDSDETKVATRDAMWDKLYPFQREGVEFTERARFKCLIADEMGLGKTVQALVTLRYHPELFPVLYVVKSATKYQWQNQILTWLENDKDPFQSASQVINSSHSEILPIPNTIISMDMLEKHKESLINRGFKCLIIDESQNFKTLDSARTTTLNELVETINPTGIICLTGTPIMNRASEFFTTLNLLRPEMWRAYKPFVWQWCESSRSGNNIGGILEWKQELFQETTKNYIIRREKREVMKDLPPFRRNYEWIVVEDEAIKDAYNNQLKKMKGHLDKMAMLRNDMTQQMQLLGYLEKLRQICALSKIPWILDYVASFLTVEENEKIILGLHHEIAIESIKEALAPWKPITITGKDNAQKKEEKKQLFMNDPSHRLMLASILACGEGLDGLQKSCSNMLTIERMWNMAKEAQFEARLDRHGQTSPVTNTFLLAKGTVDEYFTEMILEKEDYVLSAIKPEERVERMHKHASSLNFKELAEKCIGNYL